jgi:subtilisin-like proprotein convertase family protein
LDIDHTFVGDLTGVVTAPSGEQYTLFSRNGGSSDDYRNITFDNASPRSLRSSPTPYSGEYSPFEFLATPNSSEGTWTFTVTDAFGGDSGTLNAFSLRFIGAVGGSEGAAGVVKGFGVLESEQIIVRAKGSVGSADSGLAGLLKTKSSDVDVYSTFGSVGLRSLQAGQFEIDAPAAVAISSLGTDVVGRFGELTPALRADVRSAQSVAFEAPDGSIRADIESPSTVEITGFGNGISPVAAGSVDIRVVDSDVVVRDAPIGGEGVVDVDKVVKYSDLENAQLYGDVEGYVAGRIEGEGILDGSYTAGDKVLVVGDQVGTDLPAVSFVMDQLGQELKVRIVDGGGGYTIDTDIAVIFSTSPTGDTMTGVANSDDTGQIASITITNPGSGYSDTSPPTITIASPVSGGSTATAVIEYCVTVAGDRVKRLDEDGNSFDVMTTDYPGWEPVAAGEYSGKREIVWGYKNDPAANVSMITVWTLALDDSFWNGDETVYRSTDFGFMEVERRYQNDIDNDGSIGLTLIENHGSVRLELADDQQPIVDGYGVTISRGNKVYKTPEWSPVAAETVGGKNIIAWQKTQGEGTGGFLLWVCNNNWERVEGYVEPSPGTLQHGQLEVSLDLDLNGDGVKGITSDEGLRGNLIAISEGGVVFVNGNAVTKDGKDITADAYLGWRVLSAAEDTSTGGYTLLWGHASGRVAEWILNSSSAYVSDKVIPTPGDEPAFSDFIDVVQEKYQVSLSNAGFWALMPTQTITTPPVEVMKAYAPERYTGVYEVVSTGGMSQNWRLVRSVDLNTGSEFADRLMIRDMSEDKYLQIERLVGQIGNNSNGVSSRAYEVGNPETKITTASDKNMTYVVSQNNGDNQTTGSFGRVISLIEQNRIGDRRVNIGFSERVTTITPTQELPEISRSLNLDGSKRWVTSDGVSQMIDVVFDENGNASSSSASLPAGIQPVGLSGSLVTVDRENNPVSVFSDRVINGIVLTGVVGDRGQGNGQGSSQSQIAGIRNIEIGGFDDGAGILIEKSNNVIVEGVVLGAGGLANLSGNDVGIRIAGSRDVTMNEVQVSSNNVGLLVEDGDVVDAVEKLGDVPAKDLPNNASSKITNVNTTDLTIGMTVSGGDVPVGATILSIESPTQLTLSAPVITGTGTTDVPLTFTTNEYIPDLKGVDLRNNSHTPGAQVTSVTVPEFVPIGAQTSKKFNVFGFCLGNPGATITIYVDGVAIGTAVVDDQGIWALAASEMTRELGTGIYQLTADTQDLNLRRSALSEVLSVTVLLDNEPPNAGEIIILTPEITNPQPKIVGLCEPDCLVTLSINGATYVTTADPSGDWEVNTSDDPSDLGEFVHNNMYPVSVFVTDAAQNTTGPVIRTLRYNNPPVVTPPPPPPDVPPTPPEPQPPRRPTAR